MDAGAEIGLHGYAHELNATVRPEKERWAFTRSMELVDELTGAAPAGYRAPSGDLTEQTIRSLFELGIRYDSSLMAMTTARTGSGSVTSCPRTARRWGPETPVIELPFSWTLDDYVYLEFVTFRRPVDGLADRLTSPSGGRRCDAVPLRTGARSRHLPSGPTPAGDRHLGSDGRSGGSDGPVAGRGADPGVRLAGGVSLQCAARRVHHPVGWRTLVDSRAEGVPGHVDLISVPLASLGVGALVLAISEGRDWGWSSPAVLISLAVAAGFASAFVVRSKSHPAPLFDLSLFRIRTYRVALVGSVLFAGGFFGS